MGALMTHQESSIRLRPWAALLLFVSAYAPLLIILIIKDYDPQLEPTDGRDGLSTRS